jgi:hypothetical protein
MCLGGNGSRQEQREACRRSFESKVPEDIDTEVDEQNIAGARRVVESWRVPDP